MRSRTLEAVRTAILTISSRVARGAADDESGALLAELAREAGADVVARAVVTDDAVQIEAALRERLAEGVAVLLTTGGTGLTPDDVTPEATRAVIDRDAPGFAEAMRAEAQRHTPHGILTRGVSGIAGRTLVVNFPGSPKAVRELFGVIAPTLRHVADTLEGSHVGH